MSLGEQHAELGGDRDHERTERDRHRVQRHAHGKQDQRRPAAGQRDRRERHERPAHVAAEGQQQHERDDREARQQRLDTSQRRGDRGGRLGGEHRQPDELRADARRRVQARAHLVDQLLLLLQAHQADAEGERGHAAVGRDHVLGEVRRDRAAAGRRSAPASAWSVWPPLCLCPSARPSAAAANRSGSEKAGHSRARPQPLAVL